MRHSTIWPRTLWIVRHGESAGNVARDAANATGLKIIDIDVRDVDVPLSPLGERQAAALGKWFGEMPAESAYGAVALLTGAETLIARPDGRAWRYTGGDRVGFLAREIAAELPALMRRDATD